MSDQDVEIHTYTLGKPPQKTGLGGHSMKVTVLLCGTFMLMVAANTMLGSWKLMLTIGAIGAVLTGLVYFQIGPRTLAASLMLRHQARGAVKRKENLYVSGPDSKIPGGEYRAPGAMARPEMIESTDSSGAPYAMVVDRANNKATVLLELQLSGDTDRTREERDHNTADWGRFEAALSLSGDITSAVTVVSNRPATGQLAEREVNTQTSATAPDLPKRIQREAAQMLSMTGSELEAHMAVTFKVQRTRGSDEFITTLDYILPNLYTQLSWAGIEAEPMDYATAVSRWHSFVDPSTEAVFEASRVEGTEHNMTWENSGPGWALNTKDAYYHESCTSVTWEMSDAPASTFEDRVLRPLLSANANIPRSRVAMFYEPVPASQGTKQVEKEYKDALAGMNSSKSITKIGSSVRAEEVNRSRQEIARGAQLGLRSLMLTATCGPGEDIRKTRSAVEQAAAQSSIRLVEYTRMHDVGFALTAGLGQTPTTQNTVPRLLR